ncbi:MAG: hypothetical protein R2703_11140 [Micropruina glycogenica]
MTTSDEQTTRLAEALSGQLGRQVNLQVVVDPERDRRRAGDRGR